jgi:uncharacterized protein with GYD domain
MATFIMQTRLGPQAAHTPHALMRLSHEVMQRIRMDCPSVTWKASYAVLGPVDYIDIFDAPDISTATKIAAIVRTYGHATTEIWGATEWDEFTTLIDNMPSELPSIAHARERLPHRNGKKPMAARKRA